MINHPNRKKAKRSDLALYMPMLPATAADLKPSKPLSVIDRADLMLDDPDVYDIVKAGQEACNGYCPTSTTAMFAQAFAAKGCIDQAKENGDAVMGDLTAVEMHRAITYATRRRGFSLRQRRKIAVANRQKALEDQSAQQEQSDVPVAFK